MSDRSTTSVTEEENNEAFSALKDERHFEEQKRRTEKAVRGDTTIIPGEAIAANEELLASYPDSAQDLELTHLRITTLFGLGLERFEDLRYISLRQNGLFSLAYDLIDDGDGEQAHQLDDENPSTLDPNLKTTTVWPLSNKLKLEEIDLYDNNLKNVKGLENLPSLTSLDLSFNLIRSLSPWVEEPEKYAYPSLTHLYLIQNKLSKIEGLEARTKLEYLELGGNRLRVIENLPVSLTLTRLFLGKNKIKKIEGLDKLVNLKTLSLQSNRISKIEGLDLLVNLEELYLSHNGITKLEGLSNNKKLTTLDVANNKLEELDLSQLENNEALEEVWANNNMIKELPIFTKEKYPDLETLYLEGNPVQKTLGTAYRRKIMIEMPQLSQIDATYTKRS